MSKNYWINESEVQRLLEWWQPVLRLQDFDFEVCIKREHEFSGAGRAGECHQNPRTQHVRIYLLNPVDWYDADWKPYDMEFVLVHEMLHVRLRHFELATGAQYDEQELSIDVLAHAVVSFSRRLDDYPVFEHIEVWETSKG